MLIRSANEADLDALLGCVVTAPISWAHPDRLTENLADGHYTYDWIWVAERDDRIVARAVWWGVPDGAVPIALDCVYVADGVGDPIAVASELLAAAHATFREAGADELPAYHIFLPGSWRNDPAIVEAVGWRRTAAAKVGLVDELERLRYEWTTQAGVPAQSGRLTFRDEPDDQVMLEAFVRVAEGSLDDGTRKGVAAHGVHQQARQELAIYLGMPGDRAWWRLAFDAGGELVGLAIPSANPNGPVVGYLGVLPEHRGQGYVDDLLAEITRILAADGADRIAADTDVGNAPMAVAFERAGYRQFAVRLVLSAPVP
ncbi:MAG: GNAT family N-acetyltransferase [Sporichthyaceae bacterium]|nr:GNAT family N-acetyltransferase [Sporichthyaceae bacterium]